MTHEEAQNSPQTADRGSQAPPDATDAGEALVQQIAEALRGWWHQPPGADTFWVEAARAVLPLVEAQVAPLRDEARRLRRALDIGWEGIQRTRSQRDAAESALRQVCEDVEALLGKGFAGTAAHVNAEWRRQIRDVLNKARSRNALQAQSVVSERSDSTRDDTGKPESGADSERSLPPRCGCDGCTVCPGRQAGCVCDIDFGELHDSKLGGPYNADHRAQRLAADTQPEGAGEAKCMSYGCQEKPIEPILCRTHWDEAIAEEDRRQSAKEDRP